MTMLDEQIKKEVKKVAKLKRKSLKEYGFHEEPAQPGSGIDGLHDIEKIYYRKYYKTIKKLFDDLSDDVDENLSDTDYWEECSDWTKSIDDMFKQFHNMMEEWFNGLS